MSFSRRQFWQALAGSGVLTDAALRGAIGVPIARQARTAPAAAGSHIGSLYRFVQQQADRSTLELSFLRSEFRDLETWQTKARATVLERLFYAPPRVAPAAEVIRREDRGDYVKEALTFQTTPDLRVPVYVLIPKKARLPAPGIVALHCHGGFYVWGKDKLVDTDDEHPALAEYKQQLYQGRSVASELVRRGYVVIVIDAFYWGERRMLLDQDPPSYHDSQTMTKTDVSDFNRRAQQSEQLVARSLFAAGVTWPGRLTARSGCAAARLRGAVAWRLPQLPAGGSRPTNQGRRGRRLDDIICFTDQTARRQYHRLLFPYRRTVPRPRSSRSCCADCAASASGDQWQSRLALRTRGRACGLRKDQRMFSESGCLRPPALPFVRRTARVQSSDAGRGVCMVGTGTGCLRVEREVDRWQSATRISTLRSDPAAMP